MTMYVLSVSRKMNGDPNTIYSTDIDLGLVF